MVRPAKRVQPARSRRPGLPAEHHHHREDHRSTRVGWLRAAVLGANDGIVSTACLIVGMIGGGASDGAVRTAGVAGLVAGALSMAVGEYVSVSSQSDVTKADQIGRESCRERVCQYVSISVVAV